MTEKIIVKLEEIKPIVNDLGNEIKQLSILNISLSQDPISEGLASFNKRISDIQKSKDYVSATALKVLKVKTVIENMNISIEKYIMERKNKIMEEDPEKYNNLKTQALRDIALEKPLEVEIKLQSKISQLVNVIKGYYASAQLQLSNLESTNNNLKKQLDVIETMISIGEIQTKYTKGAI